MFGGLEERSIYIPFVLNIQDQILKGREMLIHHPRHIRIDETSRNFTIHPTLRRLESI